MGRAGHHLLRRGAHDHRWPEGRATGTRASGPDRGAVHEPPPVNQILRQQRRLQPQRRRLLGRRGPLAIPLGWKAVGELRVSGNCRVARVLLAALSVSGAIFLILELDQPFDGVIQISQRFNAQRSCASRPLAAGNFCSAFKNPNDRSWEIFFVFQNFA